MQIDKWAASVRLTVVDGTDPVSLALEVSGGKVTADKIDEAVGAAIAKQLSQLGGNAEQERKELQALREKVRVLEEVNAAAKKAEQAPAEPKPRGRPRKSDK